LGYIRDVRIDFFQDLGFVGVNEILSGLGIEMWFETSKYRFLTAG